MTDLEITKLCAEAMGLFYFDADNSLFPKAIVIKEPSLHVYAPLDDDAQAMALVKKLWMIIEPPLRDSRAKNKLWRVNIPDEVDYSIFNADLNRAICECVAKMVKARTAPTA